MTAPDKTAPPWRPLDVSGKAVFPFTLACPSFVYPAGYGDNVRCLAPFVDEIELLFFESRFADSLPSKALIGELAQLARDGAITFNIHLPTDIHVGHRDVGRRRLARDVLIRLIDRCLPLEPSTFTLHLENPPIEGEINRWQADATATVEKVLALGMSGRRLSIENLDYDFALAAPVIRELDLSICMDMGHLMARGIDIATFYERWCERITIAHLHGVDGRQDHLPLDRLRPSLMQGVLDLLKRIDGVVSLEVFGYKALNASLKHLRHSWLGSPADG